MESALGVFAGDDSLHSGDGPGLCSVDATYAGVGVWAAQNLAAEHAGQDDISCVKCFSGDLIRPVYSWDRLADDV